MHGLYLYQYSTFVIAILLQASLTSTDTWGSWSDWSECTNNRHKAVCSRTRDRTCTSCGPKGQGGIQQALERCQVPPCKLVSSSKDDIRRQQQNYNNVGINSVNTLPSGSLGNWGPWSQCPTYNCQPGATQTRSRSCSGGGTQSYGAGIPCPGNNQETRLCECPQQAQWQPWGGFGGCSATCGQGFRTRTRNCPQQGQCPGSSQEQQACNAGPCCQGWSQWGQCSETCGYGIQVRNQNCGGGSGGSTGTNYGNPGIGGGGGNSESRPCQQAPCSRWSNWGAWGRCSATCGQGIQTRVRTCQGGASCVGPATSETACYADR